MIAYLRFCLRLRFSGVAVHLQSDGGREGGRERRVSSLKPLSEGKEQRAREVEERRA